jgi:hypothetical protein
MVKKNVGNIDRFLRIALGLALIAWFFLDRGRGLGITPSLSASCPSRPA